MKCLIRSFAAVVVVALACGVQAREIKVCIRDTPFPPLTFPNHDGQAQFLIRKAVTGLGGAVYFTPMPWRRCLNEVRTGRQDATLAGFNHAYEEFMVFPMKGKQADVELEVAEATVVIVRKVGERANWDGVRFSGVTMPVLYTAGQVTLAEKLAQIGASGSDAAKTESQVLDMLLVERAELALLPESEAYPLVNSLQYKGKFEILPLPFLRVVGYLGFSKHFYKTNSHFAKSVWTAIRRIRVSREWKEVAPTLAK